MINEYGFPKENFICKLLGHKYTQDIVFVSKIGRHNCSIKRYRHCERCKITYQENYGRFKNVQLDNHYIDFREMNQRIYEEYEKVKTCK